MLGKDWFVLMHLLFKPRRCQFAAFPRMVLEITGSYGSIWSLELYNRMKSPRMPQPRTTDSQGSGPTRAYYVTIQSFRMNIKFENSHTYCFPVYALHGKGLQRQRSVGTLVSNQERRALLVPVMNRLLIAGQPRVNR